MKQITPLFMTTTKFLILLLLTTFLSPRNVSSAAAAASSHDDFLHCLYSQTPPDIIYTPNSPSYPSVFQFSLRNPRFNGTSTSRRSIRQYQQPIAIVTPNAVSQVQSAVLCSRNHGLHLRVRSGGHDFEGLSSVSSSSSLPFLLVDLVKLVNIRVDVQTKSAWVQAGAVLGEVYHALASASPNLAFPAGICPTVGVGGHISGGGYGTLLRKYGTAADNVLDAQLVDAEGRLMDRAAMGEDVFWAIRGGGGNSYGIVVSWKLNLVDVPSRVTAFTVSVRSEENVTRIVDRYQRVADKVTDDLFILLTINRVAITPSANPNTTIQAAFQALFLGKTEDLLTVMKQSFPELGLTESSCREMSWIESALYFANYPSNASYNELLTSRISSPVPSSDKLKAKSDYVNSPLPLPALLGLWKLLHQIEMGPSTFFQIVPQGGRMNQISDSTIPYPHRAGNIYKLQYFAGWTGERKEVEMRHLGWIRRAYKFMTPFVSKNPRGAYVNSRDLDLGMNDPGNGYYASYEEGRVWGEKYYKGNYERLAMVKGAVDPTNFFRNEQSVPPLFYRS